MKMVSIRRFLDLFKSNSKNLLVFQRFTTGSSSSRHSQKHPESNSENNVLEKIYGNSLIQHSQKHPESNSENNGLEEIYGSSLIQHSQKHPESYSENNVLQKINDDLSTVAPYLPNTFNLAAYVNCSETLQNLVHLNVNLSKIEKKPFIAEKIVKLNFNDIKSHILFIEDCVGIDNIGSFLTANPMIFYETLEDIKVRINYLQSKHFTDDQIKRIIIRNPFWLMLSTKRIDRRLGHFQDKFKLSGTELRLLAAKQPKLITYNLHHIKTNSFVIKEEMGFEDSEIKNLLLAKPKLWMIDQMSLLHRFNYIHNTMKVPHVTILKYPGILLSRNFRVKQRHLFLEKLGRAQYNPKKENYVSIIALAEDTDIDFCKYYAKCNVSDFNTFLKTL